MIAQRTKSTWLSPEEERRLREAADRVLYGRGTAEDARLIDQMFERVKQNNLRELSKDTHTYYRRLK